MLAKIKYVEQQRSYAKFADKPEIRRCSLGSICSSALLGIVGGKIAVVLRAG